MRQRAIARLGSGLWVLGLWSALACEPRDQTPAGRGARTFQRSCSGCHGPDGRGTLRPGLTRPPRDLTQAEFQARMTDEQLRHSIRIGKGQMPAFGGLMAEQDIAELIAFIRTLAPPGTTPAPQAAPGASAPPAPTAPAVAAPPAAPGAAALAPSADVAAGVVVR